MVMARAEGLHQCLCTVSRADRLTGSCIGDALPRRNRSLALWRRAADGIGSLFRLPSVDPWSSIFCGRGGCLLPRPRAGHKGTYPEGTANFAFVEPERECGPAPFGRHSACTIC